MKPITASLLMAATLIGGIALGRYVLNQAPPPPAPAPKFFNAGDVAGGMERRNSGVVIDVKEGESIQAAVAKAAPGDVIRVYPGTYRETVYIDKDEITIQGIIVDRAWPILEGDTTRNDGILYSGNGIMIENMVIQNFKGNGIMGQAGNNFVIRNNRIIDTGIYGIFPEYGTNGVVERNVLSGISDAAIYVGMCDNVDVRFNEVFNSVAGIEIENTRHAMVEYNWCYNNTGGILAFITPGLPIKTCYDIIIRNNYVVGNNLPNFGKPGSIVASLPKGTGIVVMAADDVVIENNIIRDNNNVGIAITDFSFGANMANDPDSDPNPDRITILDNMMLHNGSDPVGQLKDLMAISMKKDGIDIALNGKTNGSCIRNPGAYRMYNMDGLGSCTIENTSEVRTYTLPKPVAPRNVNVGEKGRLTYYGVCAGCHSYSARMIGPPTQVIQAMYKDNPEGIAKYIAAPERKRTDYPEMPPQNYLSEETRVEVAKFMLSITK